MLEAEEPGCRRNGRAFHAAGDDCAGHDHVDEADLGQGKGVVRRADGEFLTNVSCAVKKDCLPDDVDLRGRIFEFEAQFAAGQTIGPLGELPEKYRRAMRCREACRH